MFRTGKQTTYFQTTEQRSVYDPSRGHTFSRGQVSQQEGFGRCLEEKNSFFGRNAEVFCTWEVFMAEYKEHIAL